MRVFWCLVVGYFAVCQGDPHLEVLTETMSFDLKNVSAGVTTTFGTVGVLLWPHSCDTPWQLRSTVTRGCENGAKGIFAVDDSCGDGSIVLEVVMSAIAPEPVELYDLAVFVSGLTPPDAPPESMYFDNGIAFHQQGLWIWSSDLGNFSNVCVSDVCTGTESTSFLLAGTAVPEVRQQRVAVGAVWRNIVLPGLGPVTHRIQLSNQNPGFRDPDIPLATPLRTATLPAATVSPGPSPSPCNIPYFAGGIAGVGTRGGGSFWVEYHAEDGGSLIHAADAGFRGQLRQLNDPAHIWFGGGRAQIGNLTARIVEPFIGDGSRNWCGEEIRFDVEIENLNPELRIVNLSLGGTMFHLEGSGANVWGVRGHPSGSDVPYALRLTRTGVTEGLYLGPHEIPFSAVAVGASGNATEGFFESTIAASQVAGWITFSWFNVDVPAGKTVHRGFVWTTTVPPTPLPNPTQVATESDCPRPYFLANQIHQGLDVRLYDDHIGAGDEELVFGAGVWSSTLVVLDEPNITQMQDGAIKYGVVGDQIRIAASKNGGEGRCGSEIVEYEFAFLSERSTEAKACLRFLANVQMLGNDKPKVEFLSGNFGLYFPDRKLIIRAIDEPFTIVYGGDENALPYVGTEQNGEYDRVGLAWNVTLAGTGVTRKLRFEVSDGGGGGDDDSGLGAGAIAGISIGAVAVAAAAVVPLVFALCKKKDVADEQQPLNQDMGQGEPAPNDGGDEVGTEQREVGDAREEGVRKRKRKSHADAGGVGAGDEAGAGVE